MSEVTYTVKEEVFREATRIAKEGLKIAIKQEDSELVPKNRLEASVRDHWVSFNRTINNCWKNEIEVPEGEFSLEDFSWYNDALQEKVLKTTEAVEIIRVYDFYDEFYDDDFDNYLECKWMLGEIAKKSKSSKYLVEMSYKCSSQSPYYFIEKFNKFLALASESFSGEVEVSAEIQILMDWILTDNLESLNSVEYYSDEDGREFIKDLVTTLTKQHYESQCRHIFLENPSDEWDDALTFFSEVKRKYDLKLELEKIENTGSTKLEALNNKDLVETPDNLWTVLSSTVLGVLTASIMMYIIYNMLVN